MAQYKTRTFLHESSSAAFDTRHAPGTTAKNPGIYRCSACGEETPVCKGRALPPDNHHPHAEGQGKVEWQLIVFAEQSK